MQYETLVSILNSWMESYTIAHNIVPSVVKMLITNVL